jgi:predicted 2-oxoglutarate/Fe(II)-dependent dioxygenase YbiX
VKKTSGRPQRRGPDAVVDLDMAIQRLNHDLPDHPSALPLTGVYHNLLRKWAEM